MAEASLRAAYSRAFLLGDLALISIAAAATLGAYLWAPSAFPPPSSEARRQIYAAGASISAGLLGFTLVSITLMLDLTTKPVVDLLRRSPHYPDLFEAFLSAARFLGLTALIFLMALILDADFSNAPWAILIVLWPPYVAIGRMCRCLWLLTAVIRLAAKSANAGAR